MAYAGLRPNEVRGLRRRHLIFEKGSSKISVREGISYGEVHTPKSGKREIPIARPLARLLAPVQDQPRDSFVACNAHGRPWSQGGLDQAFKRVRDRAGFSDWSVYCLRHYAITAWLRAGIPVHVVQRMAGHKNLSTTQRYAHFVGEDLQRAAIQMGNIWETA